LHPLVRQPTLAFINSALQALGLGNAFGHSFPIGGASFYLSRGVDPEIVQFAGQWRS
ncbi:hypothetical protein K488DRAFT_28949, partial [Vararia minispora EC-137]